MADLGTTTTPASGDPGPRHVDHRQVTRRRTLPGGRAVVGALLITLAVLGVFAAWLSATAAPTTSFVVAATALAPGDEIQRDDLELVAMDLPDGQAARVVSTADVAVGAVALAPVEPGDPVLRSSLRAPARAPDSSGFSFELPMSRALAGDLVAGDRVDVVATEAGRTGFVATDVPVVASLADGGTVVVTLALADPDAVLAIAHAVDEGTVHVARSSRRGPVDAPVRSGAFAEDATTTPDQPTPAASSPTEDPDAEEGGEG